VEQATLSPTEFSSVVTAITSAFGDPTRREIYLFARAADSGVTASEVAAKFDLHANVARHHLDKLAAGGYLEVAVARGGTGAGRPSKRYTATAKGDHLDLPVRHDDVLITLLGRALDMLPRDLGLPLGAAFRAIAEDDGLVHFIPPQAS
jgi:predicted ArsR family transcriptional regulator